MNRQTYLAKNDEIAKQWWVVDATDLVLGRLSARLAMVLMGKDKPTYTPHHDVGDFVVVVNVDKIRLTGSKGENKVFQTYSKYPGGQKRFTYDWMLKHKPDVLLTRSVERMMPGSRLGRAQMKKLKVYRGAEHPHQAQLPQPLPES